MDLELKCPHCAGPFKEPRLLPCGHSLCLSCATSLITEMPLDEIDTVGAIDKRQRSSIGGSPGVVDKLGKFYYESKSLSRSGTLSSSQSCRSINPVGRCGLVDNSTGHSSTNQRGTMGRLVSSASALTLCDVQGPVASRREAHHGSVSSLQLANKQQLFSQQNKQQFFQQQSLSSHQHAPQRAHPPVSSTSPVDNSTQLSDRRYSFVESSRPAGGNKTVRPGSVHDEVSPLRLIPPSPGSRVKPEIKCRPVGGFRRNLAEVNSCADTSDKISLSSSEADSGVSSDICLHTGSAHISSSSLTTLTVPSKSLTCVGLRCPTCLCWVDVDDQSAVSLMRNHALERVAGKYLSNRAQGDGAPIAIRVRYDCQLCPDSVPPVSVRATVACQQCGVLYCDSCRERCHPMRGPLATHTLLTPEEWGGNDRLSVVSDCTEHPGETVSVFCDSCHLPVCCLCVQTGQHQQHELVSINTACQQYKTTLSQSAQRLSEKARPGSQFVQRINAMQKDVEESSLDLEALVVAQCDALIQRINSHKLALLNTVSAEKERRQVLLREQYNEGSCHIRKMTGLLQLAVELLKETDELVFLSVSKVMIGRVSLAESQFNESLPGQPRASVNFDIKLDPAPVIRAIDGLNFVHTTVPVAPVIISEECGSEENHVTVSWTAETAGPISAVNGFVLELSEADLVSYREVYRGLETLCIVEGLHFDTSYVARVRSFNHAGYSPYSTTICLHTAEVAKFTFDATTHVDGVHLSPDLHTLTSRLTEYRVVMGTVGFSRGVHYWEIRVDKFDQDRDPAFGVARFDVDRNQLLGKDDKGWSLYIDSSRSWLMHAGEHTRRLEGGITTGSIVGVLLDLDRHTATFSINRKMISHTAAFSNLHGVFYPAVSVNRCTTVTLRSGLHPPNDNDSD